jgi:hypothetical protein
MFDYDLDYDVAHLVTELNGGRVLPFIEEAFDYNTNEEE